MMCGGGSPNLEIVMKRTPRRDRCASYLRVNWRLRKRCQRLTAYGVRYGFIETLTEPMEKLRQECGVTPDGKYTVPTPRMARETFWKIHGLVQDLPVDDLGTHNLSGRVEWLIQQFKAMNMHHKGCYYSQGRWWCMRQCAVLKNRDR